MVKDHSDSERGNPLLPLHGLLCFQLSPKDLLYAPSHRQDRWNRSDNPSTTNLCLASEIGKQNSYSGECLLLCTVEVWRLPDEAGLQQAAADCWNISVHTGVYEQHIQQD